jgi:hypothetical protein
MRIEEGKYYRTRDGQKMGPAKRRLSGYENFPWDFEQNPHRYYTDEGISGVGGYPEEDLISEWTDDGPIRTVTRQEIIPGTYDGVTVHDPGSKYVRVVINDAMDHGALTRAAAVLTALAGALRDG